MRHCWGSRSTAWGSHGRRAWGGELLYLDGARCERLGRLAPLRLPGGDRAAREPWRMAAAALARAGRAEEIASRYADEPAHAAVATMLARGFNAPQTSSMGRWFDAAAGLLGVRRRMAFEGQAAMLLEGLAERHGPVPAEHDLYAITLANELDLTALAMRVAQERDPAFGAALFHATLVAALAEWVTRAAEALDLTTVAGAGGCFLNAILARGLRATLGARNLTMLEARAVPPTTAACRSDRRGSRSACWPAEADHVPRDSRARRRPARAGRRADRRRRVQKRISLALVDDVRPGDYVIVHVGYALTRLDPDEAERTLATFAEAGLLPAAPG